MRASLVCECVSPYVVRFAHCALGRLWLRYCEDRYQSSNRDKGRIDGTLGSAYGPTSLAARGESYFSHADVHDV